jgi:nucleoside-diphosphate-sugar epimerase
LLLGSTGFLGSWAARGLVAAGADVTVLTRPGSSTWRLGPILDRVTRVTADPGEWTDALAEIAPTTVLSLDWFGVAGADKDDPRQWSNLDRQAATLAAASRAGVRRFVGVGSQAEYGPHQGVISEQTDTTPVTEYGKAKLAASRALLENGPALGMESAWVRVFSTFGPLDHPYWVLPQLAEKVLRGERAALTDGRQRWSYLAGSDAGRAFATLALTEEVSGVYNLGHPDAPPLRETIETFAGALDALDLLDFGAVEHTPTSVMWLQPDMTRLSTLGWHPELAMEGALAMTARWLKGEIIPDPVIPGLSLPARTW